MLDSTSPSTAVWLTLAPALVACAYFVLGLIPFSIRCALWGIPRDQEVESRGSTILVGAFLRHYFFWVIQPFWKLVLRTEIPPNGLTALAALIGVASGVAAAAGRFALAGWLFLFSGIIDTLDGRIARARNQSSPAGAALDSILDRYVDAGLLIGLAWYYRHTWVLLPVLLALLGTSLVPYVRAKGEGLGVAVRGGMMQRLERVLFLGAGVALSPVFETLVFPGADTSMHWLAVEGILLVAVLSNLTALTRLWTVLRALNPKAPAQRRLDLQKLLGWIGVGVAVAADFSVVLFAVEVLNWSPAAATALGALVSGAVGYGFSVLATSVGSGALAMNGMRSALVSGTSILLSTGGMVLVALLPKLDWVLVWWVVRVAVWIVWELPLRRSYVLVDPARTTFS